MSANTLIKSILQVFITVLLLILFPAACKKTEEVPRIPGPPAQAGGILIDAVIPRAVYSNTALATLDASKTLSKNPQSTLSFKWSCTGFPAGSFPRIKTPEEATTIVDSLGIGKYIFMLKVKDGLGNNAEASFELEVLKDTLLALPPNIYPIAGEEVRMPVNFTSLDARTSYLINPAGRPLYFKWTLLNQPAGSPPVKFTNASTAIVGIANLVTGSYRFQLELTNELGLKNTASVEVKVLPDPLSGTTRIIENLFWTYVEDDWGGPYLFLHIAEPNTYLYRDTTNTEIRVWDEKTQVWLPPKTYDWHADQFGIMISNYNFPLEPLIGTRTKVQLRFL